MATSSWSCTICTASYNFYAPLSKFCSKIAQYFHGIVLEMQNDSTITYMHSIHMDCPWGVGLDEIPIPVQNGMKPDPRVAKKRGVAYS